MNKLLIGLIISVNAFSLNQAFAESQSPDSLACTVVRTNPSLSDYSGPNVYNEFTVKFVSDLNVHSAKAIIKGDSFSDLTLEGYDPRLSHDASQNTVHHFWKFSGIQHETDTLGGDLMGGPVSYPITKRVYIKFSEDFKTLQASIGNSLLLYTCR